MKPETCNLLREALSRWRRGIARACRWRHDGAVIPGSKRGLSPVIPLKVSRFLLALVLVSAGMHSDLPQFFGFPSAVSEATAAIVEKSDTVATTTTSTTDVLMAGMTDTPGAGDYLVLFSTSVKTAAAATIFVSIYVGGVQQPHTERRQFQEGSIVGFEVPLMTYARVSVLAGQAVEIRWRTSASTATAQARTLNLFPVASADVTQAPATADTTLNSATYTLLDSMTLTPGAGTYLALFSTSADGVAGSIIDTSLFVGGVQVAHTERSMTQEASIPTTPFVHAILAKVAPTAGQAVEVRWRNSGTAGIITAHQRTLTLYQVNAADIFEAPAVSDVTSTGTADFTISLMTLTPGAGDYLAMFSSSFFYGAITGTSVTTFHSLYVGGVKVAHTERQPTWDFSIESTNIPVATNGVVSPGAGQAVEVQWRGSNADTRTVHERTLVLLREGVPSTTKFYFHDAATPNTGTLPGATTLSLTTPTPDVTAAGAGTNRDMNRTIGTTQVSEALTTLGTKALQKNWFRRFLSRPLAAQTLPTGVWTIQGGASESNAASNMLLWGAVIKVWTPSTGASVFLLDDPLLGTVEPGTAETNVSNATASITGVNILDGDILVVELWAQNTQGTTTARTNTIFYDGTTEGSTSSNAAFLGAPGPIALHRPLDQSAYRLFNNANSTDVGTALAAQNTAATLGSTGAAFRLRMLLHVSELDLGINGQAFKLQFVGKGTGTCAAPTGGTPAAYTDVTAATVIAYNDNATPADGAILTANASDPTHGTPAHTVVIQTYEELNNFTNPTAINSGQDGMWDFSLIDNGAPAGTTYCFRAVKATGTVLDTYTVIPQITTTTTGAAGRFNAVEVGGNALTGVIKTKIAGANVSLDIVAIKTDNSGVETGFNGDVKVQVYDGSPGGTPDATTKCSPSWTLIATTPASWTVTLTNGIGTLTNLNVANVFPNARIRIASPATGPETTVGCSTDNFAIRPNTLASFAVTDTDQLTAGTVRVLNVVTFATPRHKAGWPFSVRATAVNAAGTPAVTTNYAGAPTATLSACVGAACTATFGTLTLTTTFVAGQLTSDVASYNNVGSFGLQLVDSAFASVDASDGSTSTERNITSATINVGRFIPAHLAVSLNPPVFGTACGSFTYIGQKFNYTTAPVITVTGQDKDNNTTTLYAGAWWQITNASLTGKSYTAASGTLDTSGLPGTDPVIVSTGAGVGTLTFSSGTGLFFTRTTPVAPFNAAINLAVNVIDSDGVAYAANPATFSSIAFSAGAAMRFGRLTLRNANGSQLVPLPVQLEAQYWSGAPTNAFITNAADSCTTIAATNIAMSNFTQNLNACETSLTVGGFASGRATALLSAPGSANNGSVDLTANLGATGSGTTCIGGASTAVTGANRAYLQGNWTGVNYDQNPTARAAFGVFKGAEEVIFIRENF